MTCCNTNNINRNDNYFRPNYRKKALTEKFYARHESFDCDPKLSSSPKVKHYMDWISKQSSSILKNRALAPITENQKYGWLIHLIETQDEMDSNLLYYGRKNDSQIKIMAVIEAETKRNRGYWYR